MIFIARQLTENEGEIQCVKNLDLHLGKFQHQKGAAVQLACVVRDSEEIQKAEEGSETDNPRRIIFLLSRKKLNCMSRVWERVQVRK